MNRPWMPLYVADYLADTAHLNAAQSGAYLHLIMHYWQTGSLPGDDAAMARIARMTGGEWRKARPILVPFFSRDWRHKRIDSEIARAADISSKRRASAEQRHSKSSAIAEQLDTHACASSPSHPQSQEKKKDSRAVAGATRPIASDHFSEFWRAYPKRDGANPKKPAQKAFSSAVKSGHDPETIIAGARRYRATLRGKNGEGTSFVAQALTWLRQGRWEDYPALAAVEAVAVPQPPEPDMPSHAELLKRYGGNDGATPAIDGNGADHTQKLSRAGPDICATGEGAPGRSVTDHQGGFARMSGVDEILRSPPELAPARPDDAA